MATVVVTAILVFTAAFAAQQAAAEGVYFRDFGDGRLKEFHLVGRSSVYALRATTAGPVLHLHWGRLDEAVNAQGQDDQLRTLAYLTTDNYAQSFDVGLPIELDAFAANNESDPKPLNLPFSRNSLQLELAEFGSGDFRQPSFDATYARDGSRLSIFRYRSHAILPGKPVVDATQPAYYVEDDTEASSLRLDLVDETSGLEVELWYTLFFGTDIITRRVVVRNGGSSDVQLNTVLSAVVDLPTPQSSHYTFSHLAGAWARERFLVSTPLNAPGSQAIHSRRGVSGHHHNPFAVISDGPYSEDTGEHFAFSLVYAGNFLFEAEVLQTGKLRIVAGIEPLTFSWHLAPGATFVTPEIALAYSSQGVGEISRQLHGLMRSRLVKQSPWRDSPRPILINSWEAFYFDVNEDILVNELGVYAAQLGMDMVVLDDGWFGERHNARCCLGDWYPNLGKFPNGLKGPADRLAAMGLKFGVWMEPEMISEDSDLFRAHPDWPLYVSGRPNSKGRNQLVLDLSRTDVQNYIIQSVNDVLQSANISYLKWDFNRHLSEVGSPVAHSASQQSEIYHRWVLGLYRIMAEITRANPSVLFESCSGGGGRFDPALLHYMPQVWTSDNTDAVSRMKIQYGTSIAYPLSSISAHVSEVPNNQVGRITPLVTRGLVAMSGIFGYELRLAELSDMEQAEVREQIQLYREIETIVRTGNFYRLQSPFVLRDSLTFAAWMMVSPDQTEAVVFAFLSNYYENGWLPPRLRLQGLNPLATYSITNSRGGSGRFVQRQGSLLMSAGHVMYFGADSTSWFIQLKQVAPRKPTRLEDELDVNLMLV